MKGPLACERPFQQLSKILWVCADSLHRSGVRWESVTSNEEVVIVHVAVHATRNLCRFGSECRAAALEEDHHHHSPHTCVGVGSEPTIAGSFVRTGAGLPQNLFLVEVEPQAAGCPVLHCTCHPVRKFGNDWSDIQLPLDARLKGRDLFRTRRMLQIIECSTVGDRRNHRAQLQRSHGDAFAERAHLTNTAELFGYHRIWVLTELLTRNVISSQFAKTILMGIVGHFLKAEPASERFEVRIVGMS